MDELTQLKAEAWDLARQIDAINEQVRPFGERIQSIQKEIASKMAQIESLEQKSE